MRIFIALSLSLTVSRFFFFPAQRYFQRFLGRLLDCDSSTECIRESNPTTFFPFVDSANHYTQQ